MKKNRKGLALLGLLALCVTLTVGIFMLGQSPKGKDILLHTDEPGIEVTPGGIAEGPGTDTPDNETPAVTVPEIQPPGITVPDVRPIVTPPSNPSADGQNSNNINLTVIPDRPEPPALPDTAYTGEQTEDATPEDVEAHEALDPALKNPDVKPNIAPPPPVEPARPNANAPQGGSANDKGEVYLPGFGWIKPSTPQGQQSGSDGDWDKIIGH